MRAYTELASFSEIGVIGETLLQWFSIDTLEYPDLEDNRHERAIHMEDSTPKSKATGNPNGSYIYAMYEGHY